MIDNNIVFLTKRSCFNLTKDFICFSYFVVPISSYFFNSKFNLIFFSKSSFFTFYNFFKYLKVEPRRMFVIRLFLKGVGYKVLRSRNKIYNHIYRFELGYSVTRYFFVPHNVYTKHRRDRILLFGFNKNFVVRTAKLLINLKNPDVYKGKGVRDAVYTFEPKPGKQRLFKI